MRGKIGPNDVPEEIKQRAEHIWKNIRDLMQFNPKDEPKVLLRIAAALMMFKMFDMNRQIGESEAKPIRGLQQKKG